MAEGTIQQEQDKEAGALVPQHGRAPAHVALSNGVLQPSDMEGIYRISKYIAASKMAPKGMETPEAVFVALAMGFELGLSPMTSIQNIAVVNGRPSVWGDAMLAICEASGELTRIEETFSGDVDRDGSAVCRATRTRKDGRERTVEESFSVADARRAGLWDKSGPWKQYPKRMLKYRARSFCLRDLFADRLKGIRTAEEMADVPADEFGPGKPFEIIEETRPAQPTPAAPAAPVRSAEETTAGAGTEPLKSPAHTPMSSTSGNGGATEGASSAGQRASGKEVRRATHGPFAVPGSLRAYFGGREEVQTAGVEAPTLFAIAEVAASGKADPSIVSRYLSSLNLSQTSPAYLRQAEGLRLLGELQDSAAERSKEQDTKKEAPQQVAPPEPDMPNVGEVVRCMMGEGVVRGYQPEADPGRGPMLLLSFESGDYAGRTLPVYWHSIKTIMGGGQPRQEKPATNGRLTCPPGTASAGDRMDPIFCSEQCRDMDACSEFSAYQRKQATGQRKLF